MALATIALGTGCSSRPGSDAQPPSATAGDVTLTATQRQHIRLYTVAASDYRRTVQTTGTVDFDNDQATSVLAPFSGPVSRLLVSSGDRVRRGQPLAVVDSPDFAAAVSAYSKALVSARNARRLADMDKDLLAHGGVARREAEQAATDASSAEADRDAALQALVSLDVDPKTIRDIQAGRPISRIGGTIRAPVTGTVVEKLITPGQLLQAGSTPCFVVANLSRVWVMAQISADDLASVNVGDPAEIITGIGSKNFSGTVGNISAVVNPDTRSVIARVVVDNPGDFLKKQMYVSVTIRSRRKSSGLLIPVSAILRNDENLPFVYVAEPDGSFARRSVTLGYRAGDRYEIPDGLKPGDRVVVDGGIFVQFMQNQ
ncbi:MAG: efflux RND transporter periplasmic adaptor subunit [Xanthomonadaceae bacterium]|nr:efflux RND transporter periplasmic adaptor subunit [Xanthomonadaceae bacterium]